MSAHQVIVIGGGIAGVSVAYELAESRDVALLEMESSLAVHTTGRSAASFSESYGGEVVRTLSVASRSFLENPPEVFDTPLLTPRARLWFAERGRGGAIQELHAEVGHLVPTVECLDPVQAVGLCPFLREEFLDLAMLEPEAMDIDVHALHQGYVRGFRARGGQLVTSAEVNSLERRDGRWRVSVRGGGEYEADTVVNAAGAWCDLVGGLAGAGPLGLRSFRRTVFMVPAAEEMTKVRDLPLVIDIDGSFYVKPEGVQFLCSPADEIPSDPCDARPEDIDIARAIERINEATRLDVRRVTSSWAGLRSFVADRAPVAGFDDHVEQFFWLAGQGGYGIQMAPALARASAALVQGQDLPSEIGAHGLQAADLHHGRLHGLGSDIASPDP